jgi:hypothetical protein
VFNETAFQNIDTASCGLFVLYFLFERMHNLDLSFDDIIEEIFEEDTNANEEKVKTFCQDLFN